MNYIEYELKSDLLYLGERPKGGIFKPCLKAIPFSQISGALNARFGRDDFKAVGYFSDNIESNTRDYLIYSPRDRNISISKVPLQVEYLSNVYAKVVIKQDESIGVLPDEFELLLGGLKSKGFGKCRLKKVNTLDGSKVKRGTLKVRIPLEEQDAFNIKSVIRPVYGYLFKPEPQEYTGKYVIALFEGSEVVAPSFIIKEVTSG